MALVSVTELLLRADREGYAVVAIIREKIKVFGSSGKA